MGLLGTVQGMIMAFFVTAHLPPGANKAESLAQGIYVALVTTFGGLTVAIPASMLAHYFEGRIQSLFRELDDGLMCLLPQLERFEGRLRVRKKPASSTEPPKKQPPAAAQK
jgi:biopolymer transport protein ExbB